MKIVYIILLCILASSNNLMLQAQTIGELTFSFTSLPQASNHGTKHNLAVWIQKDDGSFVKTKFRFAGDLTRDHLPNWAQNSGGPQLDCLDPNCNVVDAVTGATLLDYGIQTFTWNGTDTSGNQVQDGVYKVMIEECWKHGVDGLTSRVYSFTKGPNSDIQTISGDTCFNNVSLQWLPSSNRLEEGLSTYLNVFSNPSQSGIFHVEFDSGEQVVISNSIGQIIFNEEIKEGLNSLEIDLSSSIPGVYYLSLISEKNSKTCSLFKVK